MKINSRRTTTTVMSINRSRGSHAVVDAAVVRTTATSWTQVPLDSRHVPRPLHRACLAFYDPYGMSPYYYGMYYGYGTRGYRGRGKSKLGFCST